MAQRPTIEIDLTNENSDSGDTQAHLPQTESSTNNATTTSATATTTTTNTNCCGESNISSENVCQMATTSAAALTAAQSSSQVRDSVENEEGATGFDNSTDVLECPICLQTCIHPARLPCGHIFCFLCVKGVAYKNRRCAMCRREIPVEFLDFPQLVNGIKDICVTTATDDGYQWFYEGRNGWWQYDDRTSQDIEDAYRKGDKAITILVAGYVYTVDLENMLQLRQNEPARCRRVKRDLATIPKKGVAGLRIEGNTVTTDSNFADYVADTQLLNNAENNLVGFWNLDLLPEELDGEAHDNSNNSSASSTGAAAAAAAAVAPAADEVLDDYEYLMPYMAFPGLQTLLVSVPRDIAVHAGHALRMANDIIGSTLAHADELTAATTTTTDTTTTSTPATNMTLTHRRLPPICDDGEQTVSFPITSRNSIDNMPSFSGQNNSNGSGRTLPTIANNNVITTTNTATTTTTVNTTNRQNLIAQAVAVAAANHQAIDMFEQTLNNFHALSLHNIVDSSDDNDDEHITTHTQTQTQQPINTRSILIPRPLLSSNTTTTNTNTTATSPSSTTSTSSANINNEQDDSSLYTLRQLRF